MKIALCLSGQPRWFLECNKFFKSNIIDNFDKVDVFIHTWFDGEKYQSSIPSLDTGDARPDTIKLINDLYRPVKFIVEPPRSFIDNDVYLFDKSTTPPNNAYSMFYSIKRSIEIMSEHEKDLSFEYDFVFRSRFDYAINRKFDLDLLRSLDKMTFYSPHVITQINPHCHADFNLGCSKTMKIYGKTFENLEKLGAAGVTLATESMTYFQLIKNQVKIQEINLNNQFPPSKHAACWHSLWGHQ